MAASMASFTPRRRRDDSCVGANTARSRGTISNDDDDKNTDDKKNLNDDDDNNDSNDDNDDDDNNEIDDEDLESLVGQEISLAMSTSGSKTDVDVSTLSAPNGH